MIRCAAAARSGSPGRMRGEPQRASRARATSSTSGAALAALALVAPALAVVAAFFVVPLALSAVGAFRAADGGFTLAHFEKSLDLYTTRPDLHGRDRRAVDGADRARRDRDRRLPDARRESARGGDPALALSLAAVHSVRRRRAGDADVPRQERHAEPRADRHRADRAAAGAESCSTGAASSSPSSGSRRRS